MKGQYLTLEYLLFFVIGVVLIVSVYYNFSNINKKYESATTEYQLRMTGEMILSNAIRLLESSEQTDSKIIYDLEIPTKVSNCVYFIRLVNDRLSLECVNQLVGVDLTSYNLNIKIKYNIIYSTDGVVHLTAENGEVVLE